MSKVAVKARDKDPDFTIQVYEPKLMRKQLLETLRDIILFMQGYEKFRKIQEEKVGTFTQLRQDVRELNRLIDGKLKGYLPKGKLKGVAEEKPAAVREEWKSAPSPSSYKPAEQPTPARTELDELESQLKDIEGQLRGM